MLFQGIGRRWNKVIICSQNYFWRFLSIFSSKDKHLVYCVPCLNLAPPRNGCCDVFFSFLISFYSRSLKNVRSSRHRVLQYMSGAGLFWKVANLQYNFSIYVGMAWFRNHVVCTRWKSSLKAADEYLQ